MSVLFGLITLSISLSWCNGYCVTHPKMRQLRPDRPTLPHSCVDPYNGKPHELGTVWNSAKCMRCECLEYEVECCLRYPAFVSVPGCAVVLDWETCSYIMHEIGDSSKPCNKYPRIIKES